MVKICELCKNEFEIIIKTKKDRNLNRRFCSKICATKRNGLNNKGKCRTNEYKKELSLKISGMNNPFFGKKHKIDSINKMSESSKWSENRFKHYEFTKDQKEIFDGIMISDGSLEKPSRISSRLTLGFKYKETLERIINDLNNMEFCPIYEYKHIDKRNGNTIINFFTKTHSSNTLLKEYNRWYKNGSKVIPNDIILSPVFCYWWYVCDGFLSRGDVKLCTESFNNEDLSLLILKFREIDIHPTLTINKRLSLNKKESTKFLDYISTQNIQKEYEYKFK